MNIKSIYFKDSFLWLRLLASKALLLPILTHLELRRIKPFERFVLKKIGKVTRRDSADVRSIYKQSVKKNIAMVMNFLFLARCSQQTRAKQLANTQVIGAEHLLNMKDSSRPVLIISMYMGNFPQGFLKVMSEIKNTRKIFCFKFNKKTTNEELLFSLFRSTSQNIEPLKIPTGSHLAFCLF